MPAVPLPPSAASMRTPLLTAAAMLAFAGNSLLGRLALAVPDIDPASFTLLRLGAGVAVLWPLATLATRRREGSSPGATGGLPSGLALFVYAAAFSFAYVRLSTGTGALVLFGAVQLTMVAWGLYRGERPGGLQLTGFALAALGLLGLTLPGATAPDPLGAALMAAAGVAWGVYSLRGRHVHDPLRATAVTFALALLPAALLWGASASLVHAAHISARGALWAVLSGAVTSGLGYALWYAALRGLASTQAALVQLSVPVLAALLGIALLGERASLRLVAAGAAILVGVALGRRAPRGV